MAETINHKKTSTVIPWTTPQAWRAANQAVKFHQRLYHREFEVAAALAQEMKLCLESICSALDELCIDSCPWCPEPCCLKASVWFDFKDLLFLHFNQQPIPPVQPKANLGMPCRYLGPRGCRLPRLTRPWICTWYICPTQTAKLRNGQQEKHKLLSRTMAQIKFDRNLLENEFIRIIT